jgi:hypothetical protein
MTDLVERLRGRVEVAERESRFGDAEDFREAADEIDRLRGLCQELADVQRQNEDTYGKAADEIELLRAKLAEYENVPVRLRHIMATGKLPPDDMK